MEQLQRFIEERYQQICQFERKMEQLKNQLAASELHRGRMDPKGSSESIDFSKSILKAMMSCKRNEQYRIRMEEQLIADLESQAIPISKDSQNFLNSSVQAMKSIDAGFVGTSTSDDINKCTAETYKLFFAKQQEARKYNETRAMQQASLIDQDAAKVKLLKWLTQASRVNFERTLYKRSQQAFSSIIQKSNLDKNLAQYILRNQHGLSYSCSKDYNNNSSSPDQQQQQLLNPNSDSRNNNIVQMFLPLDPPLGKRIITFKQATVENTFKSQLKVTGTNRQSYQSMSQNNDDCYDKQPQQIDAKSSLTSTSASERQSPTTKRQNSDKLNYLGNFKDQSKQVKLSSQALISTSATATTIQPNTFRYDINYQKRLAAPSDKKYGKIIQGGGGQILETRRLLDVEAGNRGNPSYSVLARRHSDADSLSVAKTMLFNQLSSSNQLIRNTRDAYFRQFQMKFPAKNSIKEFQSSIYSSMPQLDKRNISETNRIEDSSLNYSFQSLSNKLNVSEQFNLLQKNRTQLTKESIDLNAVPIRKLVNSPYQDSQTRQQSKQDSQQINLSSVYGSFRGRKQESPTKGSSQQNSLNLSIYPLSSIEDEQSATRNVVIDDDIYESTHYSVSKRLINFSLKKRRESWKETKFGEFQRKCQEYKQLGETTSSQKRESQQALLECYDEIPTNQQTTLTQASTIAPCASSSKIFKNEKLKENQSAVVYNHSAYNSCNVSIDSSNSNIIDKFSMEEINKPQDPQDQTEETTFKYSTNLRSRSLFQNRQLQLLKKQIATGCRENLKECPGIGAVVGKGVVAVGNCNQQAVVGSNPDGKIPFGREVLERKLSLKDYYFPQSATKEARKQYQQFSDERRSFHAVAAAAAVAPFKMNLDSKETNIQESLQKKFILNISRQCSERKGDYQQRRRSIKNNRYLEPILPVQQFHYRSNSEQK